MMARVLLLSLSIALQATITKAMTNEKNEPATKLENMIKDGSFSRSFFGIKNNQLNENGSKLLLLKYLADKKGTENWLDKNTLMFVQEIKISSQLRDDIILHYREHVYENKFSKCIFDLGTNSQHFLQHSSSEKSDEFVSLKCSSIFNLNQSKVKKWVGKE